MAHKYPWDEEFLKYLEYLSYIRNSALITLVRYPFSFFALEYLLRIHKEPNRESLFSDKNQL